MFCDTVLFSAKNQRGKILQLFLIMQCMFISTTRQLQYYIYMTQ